jgi:transcriptional regulator with XRE-family HTH domain
VDELDGSEPSTAAAIFGVEVRAWRVRAELTQQKLGSATNYGRSYVAMVENGGRLGSEEFAASLDRLCGTPGRFEQLRERAVRLGYPAWFVPYLKAEREATQICDYSTSLIMGMLQTEAYARSVFRAANPHEDEETTRSRIARRFRRRQVMGRENPPLLQEILHEACLHTVVGGPAAMREQLAHLLEVAQSPHVVIQVIPFSAGAVATDQPFVVLAIGGASSIVYSEALNAGRVDDSTAAVAEAAETYDRLRAAALSPNDSLVLIRKLMEEYTHGNRP